MLQTTCMFTPFCFFRYFPSRILFHDYDDDQDGNSASEPLNLAYTGDPHGLIRRAFALEAENYNESLHKLLSQVTIMLLFSFGSGVFFMSYLLICNGIITLDLFHSVFPSSLKYYRFNLVTLT